MFIPRSRIFWAVSLGHFVNDTFMSSRSVLLAFLAAGLLPMSNAEIGLVASMGAMLGALTQPFFGYWADRTGGRYLAGLGQAWLVALFLLAALAAQSTGQYALMALPMIAMSLGSGMIHPVGSLHAAESDPTRVATHMSYFFLAGQLGLGLGPALAGLLLDAANNGGPPTVAPLAFLAALSIPSILLMLVSIPPAGQRRAQRAAANAPSKPLALADLPWAAFAVLVVMVMLRGLAQPGSADFLPVLFQQKGWSAGQYGIVTSTFWIAAGIAGVFFGSLADRYDRRQVMMWSMVLSAPAFFLLPSADGIAAIALAVAAGGFSGGSHSLIVVMAQELIPTSKGLASGAILGLIFGTGALGSLIIGRVSDSIGLGTTFQLVAIAVVLAGLLALALPGRRKRKWGALPLAETASD